MKLRRWLWNASTKYEEPEIEGSFGTWLRHLAPHKFETILGLVILCFGAGYLFDLLGGRSEENYGQIWDGPLYYLLLVKIWLFENAKWAGQTAFIGAAMVVPLWIILRIFGLITRD